jgi:predicted metal-dependent phosphoesterase TrpH
LVFPTRERALRNRSEGRADVHIHTRYSDGRASVREVLDRAFTDPRLDVIAITDHNTIEGALEAARLAPQYPLEVVVGEEITSLEGHILGLFLKEAVRPGLSAGETIAAVHAQGGLAIAAHPFAPRHDHVREVGRVPMGLGRALRQVPFDGVEVVNSFPLFAPANWLARRAQRASGVAATGGSDAHVVEAVGKGYTCFPGRTAADLALAIRQRRTAAGGSFYGPRLVLAYAMFVADVYRGRTAG